MSGNTQLIKELSKRKCFANLFILELCNYDFLKTICQLNDIAMFDCFITICGNIEEKHIVDIFKMSIKHEYFEIVELLIINFGYIPIANYINRYLKCCYKLGKSRPMIYVLERFKVEKSNLDEETKELILLSTIKDLPDNIEQFFMLMLNAIKANNYNKSINSMKMRKLVTIKFDEKITTAERKNQYIDFVGEEEIKSIEYLFNVDE